MADMVYIFSSLSPFILIFTKANYFWPAFSFAFLQNLLPYTQIESAEILCVVGRKKKIRSE